MLHFCIKKTMWFLKFALFFIEVVVPHIHVMDANPKVAILDCSEYGC
jgi:hypothetical protein